MSDTTSMNNTYTNDHNDDNQSNTNVLCNDPNGLCLVAKGCIDSRTSGVYTSLLRLAAQLSVDDSCQRIILETKSAIIHVKEFEGHAIVTKEIIVAPNSV
jgi:Ragulator complex protein LAMTOR5